MGETVFKKSQYAKKKKKNGKINIRYFRVVVSSLSSIFLLYLFCQFFCALHATWGISVPRPGIEPGPLQ